MLIGKTYCRAGGFSKRSPLHALVRFTRRPAERTILYVERTAIDSPEAFTSIPGWLHSESCPYLPDRTSTMRIVPFALIGSAYEKLLVHGWRRSGEALYRYECATCSSCHPLRIGAPFACESSRFKRIVSKNSDLSVRPAEEYDENEHYQLYEKYYISRHAGSLDIYTARKQAGEGFDTLVSAPKCSCIEYRREDGRLIAAGYVDVLPRGFSSVYFTFDPDESRRSLGVFSLSAETRIAASLRKTSYYLGFWVPGSASMEYKADFGPFELALVGSWIPFRNRSEALHGIDSAPASGTLSR